MAGASDCVFCRIVAGELPAAMVLEDDLVVGFLDSRPLFPGHVLVIPRAHHETLSDLPAELLEPLFGAVQRIATALPAALDADGTFVAENNVVSQSVPHLHVHVVPRRRKDGLRGFFWPRQHYASVEEMEVIAAQIRATL
jgi:histidine triad (HIT) family protein